jgi:hypothetical protein
MNELNKVIVTKLISIAMLEYALARLDDKKVDTDFIAAKYAVQIMEELR